jgi:hypothetical protein
MFNFEESFFYFFGEGGGLVFTRETVGFGLLEVLFASP